MEVARIVTAVPRYCMGTLRCRSAPPGSLAARTSARPTGVAGPNAIHRRTDVTIKKLSETPIMDTGHKVDARNLYDTPEAMVTVIILRPGQSLKGHITPVDVAFHVLEGSGEVEIGEERQVAAGPAATAAPGTSRR